MGISSPRIPRAVSLLHSQFYSFLSLIADHLRVIEGQDSSYFCPLDLFSNDISRIKRSINNMLENPRNNFKMYYKRTGHSDLKSILEIFLEFKKGLEGMFDLQDLISNVIANSADLFQRLKTHQLSLHFPVSQIYEILQTNNLSERLFLNDYEKVLETYLSKGNSAQTEKFNKVILFLIGMSLKDLSIMIIIRRTKKDDYNQLEISPSIVIWYKLKIIDVDLKMVKNIYKVYDLEKKLLALKCTKTCVE